MKRPVFFLYALSAFILTGSLILLFSFAYRLHKPIWNGYRVLAVPASVDVELCIDSFEQAGTVPAVSELAIPARFAFLEERHYAGKPFTSPDRYQRWFTDTTGLIRFFYIPYTSFTGFIKLYGALLKNVRFFYLEAPFVYAPVHFAAVLLLFCYCMVYTVHRSLFAAASSGFLCYALCTHSPLSLVAALLGTFAAAYWVEALTGDAAVPRKQLKERIRQNLLMIILPLLPPIFAVCTGLGEFMLFLLSLCISASAVFSVYGFLKLRNMDRDKQRLHPALKVFVMHPHSWKQFWHTRYALSATTIMAVLLFFTAVLPLFLSRNMLPSSVRTLAVPAPVAQGTAAFTDTAYFASSAMKDSDSLPDLTDYVTDRWYASALPYMNIHEPLPPITKHAAVSFDFFSEQKNGVLLRTEKVLYRFDDMFIAKVVEPEAVSAFPLERMLIRQGGFIPAVHKNVRIAVMGRWYMFFLSLSALFFPCILIIMARTR